VDWAPRGLLDGVVSSLSISTLSLVGCLVIRASWCRCRWSSQRPWSPATAVVLWPQREWVRQFGDKNRVVEWPSQCFEQFIIVGLPPTTDINSVIANSNALRRGAVCSRQSVFGVAPLFHVGSGRKYMRLDVGGLLLSEIGMV
jgi:hypothetical protein